MSESPPDVTQAAYREIGETIARYCAGAAAGSVMEAIDILVRRPDVVEAVHRRNAERYNALCAIFGEPPEPPHTGPVTYLAVGL